MNILKKTVKIITVIFLSLWGLLCIINICDNAGKYQLADWIIVLIFSSIPYDIFFFVKFRKKLKIKSQEEELKNELEKVRALKEEYENKLKDIQKICDMKVQLADQQAKSVIDNAQKILNRTEQECATKIHMANEKVAQLINESKKTMDMLQGAVVKHENSIQNYSDTYTESGNSIYRKDRKAISDEEIPALVSMGFKSVVRDEYMKETDIGSKDDELEFRFMQRHGAESQKRCDKFTDLNDQAFSEIDLNKKIELLRQAVDAFESAKQWHYNYSKGAKIYFQNFWERLHNSRCECFSWVDSVKDNLEYCILKRDKINPWILKQSEMGFLQNDIYKEFPQVPKGDLRVAISDLEEKALIIKSKKGSSFYITNNKNLTDA